MYQLHRFEFKRHALRVILQATFTLVTLIYAFCAVYFGLVIGSCYVSQTNMDGRHMVDLCFNFLPSHFTPNLASESYFVFIVFELLPFALYFVLQKPHDCFICLGKDPDRRFSMFQLTRQETQIREAHIKFGRGGFQMNGGLVSGVGNGLDLDQNSDYSRLVFSQDPYRSTTGYGSIRQSDFGSNRFNKSPRSRNLSSNDIKKKDY